MSVAARRLAHSTGFFLLLGLAILAIALLLGGGSQAVVALEDPCPTFAVEFDGNEFPTCGDVPQLPDVFARSAMTESPPTTAPSTGAQQPQ